MTLPSVNTVVIGMGTDLRPIEPARIGYYPGLCRALGLPCNTPPPVPATKCHESLECTGISAQCYAGGAWNHSEPQPGKDQCLHCFQDRLPMYEQKFPEAHDMVKRYCPQKQASLTFLHCFCYGSDSNPFGPWPTTTTTTLKPSPCPPPTPHPMPPPSPPPPRPSPCEFGPDCVAALEHYKCKHNGGNGCYSCLHGHEQLLTAAGCPDFKDEGIWSKIFCWCGQRGDVDW